jgi:NADH-quinone oxidoreductase subunit H
VSLLWILVVATVRTLDREVEDAQTRLYLLGAAALVALLAVLFWPDSKSRRGDDEDIDRPDPIGHASIPIPTIEAVSADRPPSPVLATTAARPVAGSGSDEVTGV